MFLAALACGSAVLSGPPAAALAEVKGTYDELYYSQTLDHQDPSNTARWQHRYLFSNASWDGSGKLPNGCRGPILLYTGNEGPIDAFWGSNGFMVDYLAPKWGALLVFPEERYYGKSLPFGQDSWTTDHIKYLSVENILADIVELTAHLKSTLGADAANCPVVAFGGSFGGTLTTFLRASHPEVVVGGLAASAPIGYYDKEGWAAHGIDEFTWYDIVLKDYDEADPMCTDAITKIISAIKEYPPEKSVTAFHVCDAAALGSSTDPSEYFKATEEGRKVKPAELVAAAAKITDMAFGYDGKTCIPDFVEGPGGVPGDGPGPDSWGWQSCTENLHQFSGRTFRDYKFDINNDAVNPCSKFWNATNKLNTDALTGLYGGYKLGDGKTNASNIIWSNGLLDPWHGGGFLTPGDPSTGNHWISMPHGAHHLDLRGPHPQDPPDITAARAEEEKIIRGWIDDASNV
eukprot:gene19693-2216_t